MTRMTWTWHQVVQGTRTRQALDGRAKVQGERDRLQVDGIRAGPPSQVSLKVLLEILKNHEEPIGNQWKSWLKQIGLQRLRGVGNDWRPWDKPVGKFGSYACMRLTFEIKMVQTFFFSTSYKSYKLVLQTWDVRLKTKGLNLCIMRSGWYSWVLMCDFKPSCSLCSLLTFLVIKMPCSGECGVINNLGRSKIYRAKVCWLGYSEQSFRI